MKFHHVNPLRIHDNFLEPLSRTPTCVVVRATEVGVRENSVSSVVDVSFPGRQITKRRPYTANRRGEPEGFGIRAGRIRSQTVRRTRSHDSRQTHRVDVFRYSGDKF